MSPGTSMRLVRVRRALRRALARVREDEGSAVVEFIGLTVVLLVPLVYLVLTLGRVQAAMFAAEAGARESARIVSQAENLDVGAARARAAVELAFADQGITVEARDVLELTCENTPCLVPGGRIHVTVTAGVRLPLAPDFLTDAVPMEVPIAAEHLAVVPEFGAAS